MYLLLVTVNDIKLSPFFIVCEELNKFIMIVITSHNFRVLNVPMDELVLQSYWEKPSRDNYITVANLLIEGALFDGRKLHISDVNSENVNNAPDCYLSWTKQVHLCYL